LPVDDASIDLVISNCVINLSIDKPAVFREIRRVLKPSGQFAVNDIVLLRVLPEKIANNVTAYVGCVAGASLLNDYILMASRRD
jgi:arsenite methyltransferase